ncbi:hypothetical protein DFP72DRAFT_1073926 [Ephemerocybe angulata]|uniref:Uncharacterized protein n=1 Tax=Ephemerocybe angulata TaxID=980116 RepID=A0A8H6HKR9_9AGAR|nr:hypothetical protein DFP72DRAFT_1073926 [Tulosesus angulatus]
MKSPLGSIIGLALCTALFFKGAFAQAVRFYWVIRAEADANTNPLKEYNELDARSAINVPFAEISERHVVDVPFQPSLRSFLEEAVEAHRRTLDEYGDELAARVADLEFYLIKQNGQRMLVHCSVDITWGECKHQAYMTTGSIYTYQWFHENTLLQDPHLVSQAHLQPPNIYINERLRALPYAMNAPTGRKAPAKASKRR